MLDSESRVQEAIRRLMGGESDAPSAPGQVPSGGPAPPDHAHPEDP
jgi:hypothetical protein